MGLDRCCTLSGEMRVGIVVACCFGFLSFFLLLAGDDVCGWFSRVLNMSVFFCVSERYACFVLAAVAVAARKWMSMTKSVPTFLIIVDRENSNSSTVDGSLR